MTKLIIAGHGKFASGILSALELIAGKNDNIIAIDFKGDDDGSELYTRLSELTSDESSTIVLTDLYGGTPFRQAVLLSMKRKQVYVVAGTNLGLLLELSMKIDNSSIESILENVEEIGTQHIQLYKKE